MGARARNRTPHSGNGPQNGDSGSEGAETREGVLEDHDRGENNDHAFDRVADSVGDRSHFAEGKKRHFVVQVVEDSR